MRILLEKKESCLKLALIVASFVVTERTKPVCQVSEQLNLMHGSDSC